MNSHQIVVENQKKSLLKGFKNFKIIQLSFKNETFKIFYKKFQRFI